MLHGINKDEFEKPQVTKEDGEEIQYFPKVFSSPLSAMKNQTSKFYLFNHKDYT